MKKWSAMLVAATLAFCALGALAADQPKGDAPMKADTAKKSEAALKKPADVTQAAWDKMSDAEKKKAVEQAAAKSGGTSTAAKKEKKGGC
jgi:Spy/CpxP family protein refolding chaperone